MASPQSKHSSLLKLLLEADILYEIGDFHMADLKCKIIKPLIHRESDLDRKYLIKFYKLEASCRLREGDKSYAYFTFRKLKYIEPSEDLEKVLELLRPEWNKSKINFMESLKEQIVRDRERMKTSGIPNFFKLNYMQNIECAEREIKEIEQILRDEKLEEGDSIRKQSKNEIKMEDGSQNVNIDRQLIQNLLDTVKGQCSIIESLQLKVTRYVEKQHVLDQEIVKERHMQKEKNGRFEKELEIFKILIDRETSCSCFDLVKTLQENLKGTESNVKELNKDKEIMEQVQSKLEIKISSLEKHNIEIKDKQKDKYLKLNKEILKLKNNLKELQVDTKKEKKIAKDNKKAIEDSNKQVTNLMGQLSKLKYNTALKFKLEKEAIRKELNANYFKLTKQVEDRDKWTQNQFVKKILEEINTKMNNILIKKEEFNKYKLRIKNKLRTLQNKHKEVNIKYQLCAQKLKKEQQDRKEMNDQIGNKFECIESHLSPFNLFNILNDENRKQLNKSRKALSISRLLRTSHKNKMESLTGSQFLKLSNKSCISNKKQIKTYGKEKEKATLSSIKAYGELVLLFHGQVLKLKTHKCINNIQIFNNFVGPRDYHNSHRKTNKLKSEIV